MKITGFIFDLSKGGAQGVFVTVMNYFCENGYNVDIVTQNLNEEVHVKDINSEIDITSLNAVGAKSALFALIDYVKNNEIECAWAFGPELCVNLYLAKILCKKKFPILGRSINTLSVEFKHTKSLFRRIVTHTLIKLFFHKIDYVVAQSINMGDDLVENYRFSESQVIVINNALSKKYEEEIRKPSQIERDNYLLYVGRLEQQKGLPMLLTAFSEMENKGEKLILLGDGGEKNRLQQMTHELKIEQRVQFESYTNQTIQYYEKAEGVILSSYFEGFPNVLIEALSCGTPIVSFDSPSGPSEIIVDGINGYLVEYCNVGKLAEAMDLALSTKWDHMKIKETSKKYTSAVLLEKYMDLQKKCEANIER